MPAKTVLVTGANTGIGYGTAVILARQGFEVVMVARSRERGEAALSEAKRDSRGGNLHLMLADLSKQADVRRLAEEFKSRFQALDVLVNNAAIIPAKREVSADGIEMQVAVNHLAPFLLTHLLLDALKAAPAGRVVNVASLVHEQGIVDFSDFQHERRYDMAGFPVPGWQAYANTKLMNVLFTYELARRLEGTRVTTNTLHPGVIGTQLIRNVNPWFQRVYRAVMPGPERGARTSVYLASSPAVEGVTGKYFGDNRNEMRSSEASYDRSLQSKLWALSEQLTHLNEPVRA